MGNKYHLCTSFSMLAQVYHKLNQNDKALQYILQAERVADEVGARADLKEIYKTRAEIEQQAGNYKLASEYFQKHSSLVILCLKLKPVKKLLKLRLNTRMKKNSRPSRNWRKINRFNLFR